MRAMTSFVWLSCAAPACLGAVDGKVVSISVSGDARDACSGAPAARALEVLWDFAEAQEPYEVQGFSYGLLVVNEGGAGSFIRSAWPHEDLEALGAPDFDVVNSFEEQALYEAAAHSADAVPIDGEWAAVAHLVVFDYDQELNLPAPRMGFRTLRCIVEFRAGDAGTTSLSFVDYLGTPRTDTAAVIEYNRVAPAAQSGLAVDFAEGFEALQVSIEPERAAIPLCEGRTEARFSAHVDAPPLAPLVVEWSAPPPVTLIVADPPTSCTAAFSARGTYPVTCTVTHGDCTASAVAEVIVGACAQRLYIGDANCDNGIDIADAICILTHLFGTGSGGCREPCCAAQNDANADNRLDIADPISVLSYLFAGGHMTGPDGSPILPSNAQCTLYARPPGSLPCRVPCAP